MNPNMTVGELRENLDKSEQKIFKAIQAEISNLYTLGIHPNDILLHYSLLNSMGRKERIMVLNSVKIHVDIL